MKKRFLLWLLVGLVLLHAFAAIETNPELRVLGLDDYVKQLQGTNPSGDKSEPLAAIAYRSYFALQYARHLVASTLIIDVLMLCCLAIFIKKDLARKLNATEGLDPNR